MSVSESARVNAGFFVSVFLLLYPACGSCDCAAAWLTALVRDARVADYPWVLPRRAVGDSCVAGRSFCPDREAAEDIAASVAVVHPHR